MAVTWKKLAYEADVILESDYSAKGTIIAGSGAGTAGALAVGTNGYYLVADSTETTGLKWAALGAPAAHASSHKNSGGDEILLHEFGEPTSAVEFNGQQAQNLIVHTVADATARGALTAVVGKIAFQTDETAVYACTSAS